MPSLLISLHCNYMIKSYQELKDPRFDKTEKKLKIWAGQTSDSTISYRRHNSGNTPCINAFMLMWKRQIETRVYK